MTFCSVSTSSCAFTNWLGNSALSLLGKMAFNFSVPVVVSITLSSVNSEPLANFVVWSRSNTSTFSFCPFRSCC